MNDIYNRDKIIKISINKIEKCGEIIFKKKTFWHKAHYEIYAPLSMRKYIDSDWIFLTDDLIDSDDPIDSDWIFPTNDPINKLIEDKLDLNVCFIKDNYIYCKASVEINFVDDYSCTARFNTDEEAKEYLVRLKMRLKDQFFTFE